MFSAEALGAAAWGAAAHGGQRAPEGDWRTWVFLGGRGAGKTRAGAEWVWDQAARLRREVGAGGRIALVGPTMHDARAVMVEGPSGVMSLPWRSGARFEPSLRRVVFPGGVTGMMFSAEEPERLRGPQFHAAWGDELCAWGRGEETLAMLRLGLRLGAGPRLMLTSTPKPTRGLRALLGEPGLARTDAATRANAGNLSPGFLEAMKGLYGGTRRAAQELEGRVLEAEGALFTEADLARARGLGAAAPGRYERTVVAVDPPAGTLSGEGGDGCGIVVASRSRLRGNDEGAIVWVRADRSARGLSPNGWAARVAAAAAEFGAGRVVAEANQGGAMVESVLKAAGLTCPVRRVHARVGKRARAEPVAALYEQGRVAHCGAFARLEEELMTLGAGDGGGAGSPDRADALVWAVTDLLIDGGGAGPRIRAL